MDRQSESQGLDGELVLKLEQDLKGARELRRQSRDEEKTPVREQRPEFIRASKVMTFRPHSGGGEAANGNGLPGMLGRAARSLEGGRPRSPGWYLRTRFWVMGGGHAQRPRRRPPGAHSDRLGRWLTGTDRFSSTAARHTSVRVRAADTRGRWRARARRTLEAAQTRSLSFKFFICYRT